MNAKFIVAVLLAASALPAGAATLFQSIPDLTVDPALNSYCSSCAGTFRVFDSFTLGSAATIESVTFAVQNNFGGFPFSIDVSFWTNDGGTPGMQISNILFAPASFTSTVATAFDTSLVSVDYTQSLAAGTYLISFFNGTDMGVPSYTGGGGNLFLQGFSAIAGQSAGFSLGGASAAIPEPASWALMVVGFGLVGAAARRRTTAITA